MEAKKITKKEFINILIKGKSANIGYRTAYKDFLKETFSLIEKFVPEGLQFRTVEKVQTNGIVFSDGSKLGHDQYGNKEYYKVGTNVVLQYTVSDWSKSDRTNDDDITYSIVIYYVK